MATFEELRERLELLQGKKALYDLLIGVLFEKRNGHSSIETDDGRDVTEEAFDVVLAELDALTSPVAKAIQKLNSTEIEDSDDDSQTEKRPTKTTKTRPKKTETAKQNNQEESGEPTKRRVLKRPGRSKSTSSGNSGS